MKSFVAVCLAALVVGSTAQFCPLCGEAPVEQSPPVPNTGVTMFNFDICCPFSESEVDDCVPNPTGEMDRSTSLNQPITDDLDFVDICLTLDSFIFEKTDRTDCCVTCSCYGDPNCVDFEGNNETWVVCDAREIPPFSKWKKKGFCPLTEAQCDQEVDPLGEPCVWMPEKMGIDPEDWSVYKYGSPCQPTDQSSILMYEADSYRFEIFQGAQGWVTEVALSNEDGEWTMTAADCVNNNAANSWDGPSPLPDYFVRLEEDCAPDGNDDIIWKIQDPFTGIGTTIRCTSNKYLIAKMNPRMNIEGVTEPDLNYASTRNPIGGFCFTGDLGNTNPSPNTEEIEEGGYCFQNMPNDNVTIARIVCENPSITLNGVLQCKKDFCNQYDFPYYGGDFDLCYSTIKADFALGFCKAFNELPLDIEQCLTKIEEEGWEEAVMFYYNKGHPVTDCIDQFDLLPDSLGPCEKGVLLQYLDDNTDTWITVKAIKEQEPVCADAIFELCIGGYPELFNNRIRWFQKRETVGCLVDDCAAQNGFGVELRTQVTTASPTKGPSMSPTTPEPTKNPTLSPTPNPSASPTTSPVTGSPTQSPSKEPTGSPFQRNPPALCPDENIIPFNISEENLRYNNLGGQGPAVNDTCPFIWFENALVIDGNSIDLVLRVLVGDYRPSNTDLNPPAGDGVINNGDFGQLGQINLACDSTVFLEFMFIRSDCGIPDCDVATDTSCDIEVGVGDGLIITTYDIDQFKNGANQESVVYCNVEEDLPVEGSTVTVAPSALCEGGLSFSSTEFGTDQDNPMLQDIDLLDENQRQKIGQIKLQQNLTRVRARYGLAGPDNPNSNPRCGRRILFSGDYCDITPADV